MAISAFSTINLETEPIADTCELCLPSLQENAKSSQYVELPRVCWIIAIAVQE